MLSNGQLMKTLFSKASADGIVPSRGLALLGGLCRTDCGRAMMATSPKRIRENCGPYAVLGAAILGREVSYQQPLRRIGRNLRKIYTGFANRAEGLSFGGEGGLSHALRYARRRGGSDFPSSGRRLTGDGDWFLHLEARRHRFGAIHEQYSERRPHSKRCDQRRGRD